MLGHRDPQRSFFEASSQLGESAVDQMGLYGKLSKKSHRFFRDEDFVAAYCRDNGRPSTPPSLLAVAHLLQHFEGISDAEVIERTRFDLRWKLALDLDPLSVAAPFAKSTFQAFRARLTLHAQEGLAFERSVQEACASGLLPRKIRVALDSSPVRGRGAVKDTYNLLSDAIAAVLRGVAQATSRPIKSVAGEHDLGRHVGRTSVKGSELVDWSDPDEVSAFLARLLEDCDRVIDLAESHGCAKDAVALLRKVREQDIEEPDDPDEGPQIRQGVAKGRTLSVSDPEIRHAHKSSGRLFAGHKAHVAVDTESGVITAVGMTSASHSDGREVQSLLEQTAETTGREIIGALADAAYSSRESLRQAQMAGVDLLTKMPRGRRGFFGPGDFHVSPKALRAVCPAGHESQKRARQKESWVHRWSPERCGTCPLREQCTTGTRRSLLVAPDFHDRRRRERLARSKKGRRLLKNRVRVEHGIGRLKQRGAGRSRYFGCLKTSFQWLWTAAAVNLSQIWSTEAVAPA